MWNICLAPETNCENRVRVSVIGNSRVRSVRSLDQTVIGMNGRAHKVSDGERNKELF